MPDVRNCRRCNRLFNYMSGPPICNDCKDADEKDFQRIKDYLYTNPGTNLTKVASDCEISIEKIKRFLKEGRLEVVGDANFVLECEICKKPISTGRLCATCQKSMKEGFDNEAVKMKAAEEKKKAANKVGMLYKKDDKK